MALQPIPSSSAAPEDFTVIGQNSTFKVNPNNTTTPIEQITVYAPLYGVTFTFNVSQHTFQTDGARALAMERVTQVNYIGGHDHVVGLRGEEDQGSDGNLYNYLVVTVGSDDGERTTDIRLRMDELGGEAAFGAIDKAWQDINALSPVT